MSLASTLASGFRFVRNVVVCAALVWGGRQAYKTFIGEGNAKLPNMAVGGLVGGNPRCWLTFDFRRIPEGIDPREVRVVFSSDALVTNPKTFEWGFIAGNAQVPKSSGVGRVPAEGISAGQTPKLNYPFDVSFPLDLKPRLQAGGPLPAIWLEAQLFWGGRKQDTARTSLGHLYEAEH
ncbi:MAG: hypothetical protein HY360_25355 [Verrucomicrobia bacterium]|nr:hypothetical protein [Verrucomicrobiota bacterium]